MEQGWGRCPIPSLPHLTAFRELGPVDNILGPLTEILEGVLQADPRLLERTKAKVFSAFITVLQMKELHGEGSGSSACQQPACWAALAGTTCFSWDFSHYWDSRPTKLLFFSTCLPHT